MGDIDNPRLADEVSVDSLWKVVAYTLLAGMAMPLGAAFASVERIRPRWLENELRHGVIAFGGGALLAAVALVLVPQAIVRFEPTAAALWFCAGGVAFMGLDILLARSKTAAIQMALQNLPEGFNAYREMNQASGYSRQRLLSLFAAAALLGPVAGVSGYLWLDDSPQVVAAVMLFAAGGILYSVFQDIAPQAKLNKHWAPSLGALLGFMLGIV